MPTKIEASEQRFATQAGTLNSEMVDLNHSMSRVQKKLDGMLIARSQLMGMYGVPADPKWKPNTPATAAAAVAPPKAKAKAKAACAIRPPSAEALAARAAEMGAGTVDVVSYKGKLLECIAKKTKKAVSKDELVFTVTGEAATGGFSCTISGADVSKEYTSPSLCISKGAAQSSAAAEALKAEFPEVFATLSPPAVDGRGQKRKSDAPPANLSDKSHLNQLIQVMIDRPLTKEDIIYTIVEKGEGVSRTFIATVTFPTWNKAKKFAGAAAGSKKEAEMKAAKLAYDTLMKTCKPIVDEYQAKKKAKNAEALEKLKARVAEKKEAEKKEAEANGTAPKPATPKPAAPKVAAKKAAAKK